MQVAWIGQDGRDRVGHGAAVGPDGIQDAHLVLTNLAPNIPIETILIDGPGAGHLSLRAKSGGGLVRANWTAIAADPSRADLYLNPDRNLDGLDLSVIVVYANGTQDLAVVTAGPTDPNLEVAPPDAPPERRDGLTARWLGQDGLDLVGPGDVHLALDGLPAGRRVVGAVLTDVAGTSWVDQLDPSTTLHTDPGSDAARVSPDERQRHHRRSELPARPRRVRRRLMTVRLVFDDGSIALAEVAGQAADLGRRAAGPGRDTSVVAHPGDDLNDLANRFGTVHLSAGNIGSTGRWS